MCATVVDGCLNGPLSVAFGLGQVEIILLLPMHRYLSIVGDRMRVYFQAFFRSDEDESRLEYPTRLTIGLLINCVKGQDLPKDH